MKIIKKFLYFLTRDILIWKSYKTQAVLGILSGFLGLLQFGFMGRFIAQGNYFPMIELYDGIYWFKKSFDKARKYGTISQY
nr:hypothetical protein [Marinitoga lauensis]